MGLMFMAVFRHKESKETVLYFQFQILQVSTILKMAAEVGTGSVFQTRTRYRILHYSVIADSNLARLMVTQLKKWEEFSISGGSTESEFLTANLIATGHIIGAVLCMQNQVIF